MSQMNFYSPKDVRAIEVLLYRYRIYYPYYSYNLISHQNLS